MRERTTLVYTALSGLGSKAAGELLVEDAEPVL